MEELREKLNSLIESKGPLDEETLYVSRKLDKLILGYFEKQVEDGYSVEYQKCVNY
jgi:hypothetical protein